MSSESERDDVLQLAYQLQAQGPDEYPFGYYVDLARKQIDKG